MKICSIFRSGHFLFLLCLFTVEGKKSPTGKHPCRKEFLSQVTENLYIKATSLKSSVPKDLIKTTRLLKKSTKMLFMQLGVGRIPYSISNGIGHDVEEWNDDTHDDSYNLNKMTNCSVRDQLLSFYVKNVFSHLEVGSDKLYIISAFQVLQVNMDACHPCAPSTTVTSAVKQLRRTFFKLGDKGIYKAIHELDILLPWIQAYIQTIL